MKCVQTVFAMLRANDLRCRINGMLRLILTLCCLTLIITLFTLSRCHINGWRWMSTSSTTSLSAILITLGSVDADESSSNVDIDVPLSNELKPIFVNTSMPTVNPHPFRFVINCPNKCKMASLKRDGGSRNGSDGEILVINYVHSSVAHFEKRYRIRATWGNESMYQLRGPNGETIRVKTVFFTGLSVEKSYLQPALQQESELYGDIVQEDFYDSYRYVTLLKKLTDVTLQKQIHYPSFMNERIVGRGLET
jgi:Galactosyltransferase